MHHFYKFGVYFICYLCALLTISCGGPQLLEDSLSSPEPDDQDAHYELPVGGSVKEIQVEDDSVRVNTSELASDQDVVFVIFSHGTSRDHAFQIQSDTSDATAPSLRTRAGDAAEKGEFVEAGAGFHALLRRAEREFEGESPARFPAKYLAHSLTVGSVQDFKVMNSFAADGFSETVAAKLRYQTEYFNFFVDERDAGRFLDEELADLAQDFAAVVPLERELFGTESDVNGDGRFNVLFTRAVNELGSQQGGMITGFFYAADLFESGQHEASNEMEILYLVMPDPKGEFGVPISKSFALNNVLPGVLPHEYQHMINFNQHHFVFGGSSEAGWLNEGLSHLAEDLLTWDGEKITGAGPENPVRVVRYLARVSTTCFVCGANLAQRGGAYLFVKYLYEQAQLGNFPNVADGREFLQLLVQTPESGMQNIVSVVFGEETPVTRRKKLLGQFYLAIYLSQTQVTSDSRFHFFGLNLRGLADDNRGTNLEGPHVEVVSALPFTETLTRTAVSYLKIPADVLARSGGRFEFSFDGPEFGGFMVY